MSFLDVLLYVRLYIYIYIYIYIYNIYNILSNIAIIVFQRKSPSLITLNAALSRINDFIWLYLSTCDDNIIAYNMMYKLTLITYMYTSLLQKHSIKNTQKFSLCIRSRNSFLSSFSILQRNFEPRFPNSRAVSNRWKMFSNE